MATSPKHLEEAFQNEVTKFEENFDRILSSKKITKGQSVEIDVPSSLTWQHFIILKARYVNAGWSDVVWKSAQRDGDFLSFKY